MPLLRRPSSQASMIMLHHTRTLFIPRPARADDLAGVAFHLELFIRLWTIRPRWPIWSCPTTAISKAGTSSATHAQASESAFTLARPVVEPEFNTKQTADVFIALARELGTGAHALRFQSAEQAVKQIASELHKHRGLDGARRRAKISGNRLTRTRRVDRQASAARNATGPGSSSTDERRAEGASRWSAASESEYALTLTRLRASRRSVLATRRTCPGFKSCPTL